MSAIFGFVNLDDQPASQENIHVMAEVIGRWGTVELNTRYHACVAMGHALLAISPESSSEAMPFYEPDSGLFLSAAARLDNRDELLDYFCIPNSKRSEFPDGRLVFLCYEKWKEETPTHLFGDWSFAVWHIRERKMFLSRDRLGNTGLFYYYRPPFFAFSSHLDSLLALPQIESTINEKYIASYLTFISLINEDETCWMDITMLLSGFSMEIDSNGIRTRRYWKIDDITPLRKKDDLAYVEEFLHLYQTAVKTRLRSRYPVGCSLSAGLDSGSVTALAARALKEEGKTLNAYTSIPLYSVDHLVPGALTDEWPLACDVSTLYDNINHQAVNAACVSPITGIERAVSIFRSPQHAAANEYWIMALHDLAREQGVGVLLTGQLGNGGVSWSGGKNRILYLLMDGKWDEGIQAMTQWKRNHGCSWVRMILGLFLKPIVFPYWNRMQAIWKGANYHWNEGAIHPDFANRIGLRQALKTKRIYRENNKLNRPFEERRLTLIRNGTMVGPLWHQIGTVFGMDVRDPTADIRLLEYCLAVPGEQDTFAGGQRMLIRRAMQNILPPQVQWNNRRGRQAADLVFRIIHHHEQMEAMLARIETQPNAIRYLDLALMSRTWRELKTRVSSRTASRVATTLLRGIMCGCFLLDES